MGLTRAARSVAWIVAAFSVLAASAHSRESAGAPIHNAQQEAIPAWRAAKRLGVITINGEIDAVTLRSVARRIEACLADGTDMIVLDIDTPGGDLKSTLDLCALLRATPVRTLAWVHPQAYSAGAILALAADAIVVSPAGVFGDAAPITALPGVGLSPLPDTERAKVEAPVLSEVVESARRVGRDERLVQRFVRLGEPLWLVERADGVRTIVDRQELASLGLSEEAPAQRSVDGPAPEPWFQSYGRASLRGSTRARLTSPDGAQWSVIAQVAEPGTLLTVREREALALGLAEGTVASDGELSAWTGGAVIVRHEERWSEGFVRWLTSWPVRLVLVAALLICFVGEMLTAGVGAFGLGATACLLALVGAPALVGLSEWWTAVAVIIGLGLVAIEILLIPGSTWIGIAGALCFCLGLVGTFTGHDLGSPEGRDALPGAAGIVLGGLALGGVGLWAIRRSLQTQALSCGAILTAVADEPVEGDGSSQSKAAPVVGDCGVADTTLRPSGQARFGARLIDVVAIGPMVDAGAPVRVVRIDGITTEVELVTSNQPQSDSP